MNTSIAIAVMFGTVAVAADEKAKPKDSASPAGGAQIHLPLEDHKGPPYVAKGLRAGVREAFKEPLLTDAKLGAQEIHRFVCVPTFSSPMAFRLEVADESHATIYVKQLSGKGGSTLGRVDLATSAKLDGEPLKKLLKLLRDARAHKPYGALTKEHVEYIGGLDGSDWYLERRRNNEYRCTYVFSARGLPKTREMLIEAGSEVYKQLDPEAFIAACTTLARAGGFVFDDEGDVLTPIKR